MLQRFVVGGGLLMSDRTATMAKPGIVLRRPGEILKNIPTFHGGTFSPSRKHAAQEEEVVKEPALSGIDACKAALAFE